MMKATCDRVIRVLAEVENRPIGGLTADTALTGPGATLDSVKMMEALLALEVEFEIQLKAGELVHARALKTVGHLASFIDSKISS